MSHEYIFLHVLAVLFPRRSAAQLPGAARNGSCWQGGTSVTPARGRDEDGRHVFRLRLASWNWFLAHGKKWRAGWCRLLTFLPESWMEMENDLKNERKLILEIHPCSSIFHWTIIGGRVVGWIHFGYISLRPHAVIHSIFFGCLVGNLGSQNWLWWIHLVNRDRMGIQMCLTTCSKHDRYPVFFVIARIRQNMLMYPNDISDCKHLESRNSPQMSTKTTSFSCQLGWPVLFSSIGRGVSKRSAVITSSLANNRFQCLFLQWKVRLRLLDTFSGICWCCLKVFDDMWIYSQ